MFGILIATDGYAMGKDRLERLEKFPGYFVGNQSDAIRLSSDLGDAGKEEFLREGYTDRYASFVKGNEKRIIPVGHILGLNEFSVRPYHVRKHLISVPGEPYANRRSAVESLREAGFDVGVTPPYQNASKALSKMMGLDPRRGRLGIWFYNWSFRRLLADSRMCYTEGSRLRRPLRKFLEIPASSSLLLCESNLGIERRGFQEGTHYLEATPEELPRVARWVMNNEAVAQKIVQQGFDLVRQKHTIPIRAWQMGVVLERIREGTFSGVTFENGEFAFH